MQQKFLLYVVSCFTLGFNCIFKDFLFFLIPERKIESFHTIILYIFLTNRDTLAHKRSLRERSVSTSEKSSLF